MYKESEPKDCIDMEQLYEDFKHHIDNMNDEEVIKSIRKAECEVEELLGEINE